MKKYMILGGAMLAMVGLSSCDESFDDWAAPSTNEPEATLAAYGIEFTASNVEVDMNDAARPDSIRLVSLTASSDEITGMEYDKVTINGCKIPYTIKGNDIYVGTYALDSLARLALNSQKYEKRALTVAVDAHALLKSGASVAFSKELIQYETPVQTPAEDPNGYYLLGEVSGNGWNPASPVWLAKVADGIYEGTVTTTGAGDHWYKYYGGTDWGDWDGANAHCYGCDINGDASLFNFINWTANLQCPVINGEGLWKVRLDVNNWTYTINEVKPDLYMTGDKYGWGNTWLPMVPCYGSNEDFWTIIYLHEGEMFKFAPQAGWGDDFGGQAEINDVAGANITVDGSNNLVCGKAGWYLLYINNGSSRKFNVLPADVYLMGNTAGEWNINPEHKFTVPATEDGQFVSPTFVADGELRMCVNIDGFDWWKTEFIIADGKIDYRGRGGDQARLNVGAGQKAYLNFTTNTGEVK
ncbi:MAG: DUF5115 domain-containing protein [Prevotella sp.]|nr:DUF5115 domain-containing protein [Prevotella sp.]